jgi:hypothetical protein
MRALARRRSGRERSRSNQRRFAHNARDRLLHLFRSGTDVKLVQHSPHSLEHGALVARVHLGHRGSQRDLIAED